MTLMAKALDIVLGIGTAVIIYLFFILALSIVFQAPEYPRCYDQARDPFQFQNMTDEERAIAFEEQNRAIRDCEAPYNELRSTFQFNMFIGAVSIGLALVVSVIFLQSMIPIATGIAAAGVALIIYGFATGWNQTGDFLRLGVLFIGGIIIIGIYLYLHRTKPTSKGSSLRKNTSRKKK